MKARIAGVIFCSLSVAGYAAPSPRIVNACLSTQSTSKAVTYTEIAHGGFNVEEDEEAKKISITVVHGKDTAGIWKVAVPKAFGLVYNGKQINLKQVVRLDKRNAPAEFDIYKAIWGEAREGGKAYLCITFNFDGLGQSGSFQNVRGAYLIEKQARAFKPFYAAGDIRHAEK